MSTWDGRSANDPERICAPSKISFANLSSCSLAICAPSIWGCCGDANSLLCFNKSRCNWSADKGLRNSWLILATHMSCPEMALLSAVFSTFKRRILHTKNANTTSTKIPANRDSKIGFRKTLESRLFRSMRLG